MKFLISGLGSIGRRHFRNLISLGEGDILLHRTHHATLPDDELAGFPVESDLPAALAQRPDAVIVANPTACHLSVAIPAAEAGCHILLEKPISHSLDGVADLKAALQRGGGQALVGFQFRYHPGLHHIKRLLADGMLGKVISVRAHWGEYLPNWHPWEDYKQGYAARTDLGGGVVLTLSHPLDYLRWLLGDVDTLWAYIGNQGLGMPVEDTAEIGLRFHSGVLGSLHLDYVQRPPTHILELVGTHGTIYWDNADGIARLARVGGPDADSDPDHLDQQLASIHSKAGPWEAFSPPEGFERNWLFLDELRHFMSVIRGEATPACTLDDGIQALRLSLAVHQSACLGQMIKF